jgi:hypothetical protein
MSKIVVLANELPPSGRPALATGFGWSIAAAILPPGRTSAKDT